MNQNQWTFGPFTFGSQELSAHNPECPFYNVSSRSRRNAVKITLPYFWRSAGYYITLDVSIGAANTILGRALACRRVLPWEHPALALFWRWEDEDLPIEDLKTDVLEMFAEGSLSPNDVDPFGRTLLHVSPTPSIFAHDPPTICDLLVFLSVQGALTNQNSLL